jgi:hypothetical protein
MGKVPQTTSRMHAYRYMRSFIRRINSHGFNTKYKLEILSVLIGTELKAEDS